MIIEVTPPPNDGGPDRHLASLQALRSRLLEVMMEARSAGWDRYEVAFGMLQFAIGEMVVAGVRQHKIAEWLREGEALAAYLRSELI